MPGTCLNRVVKSLYSNNMDTVTLELSTLLSGCRAPNSEKRTIFHRHLTRTNLIAVVKKVQSVRSFKTLKTKITLDAIFMTIHMEITLSIKTVKTLKTTKTIRITSCNPASLVTYSGDTMKTLRTCKLPLTIAGVDATLLFQVV